MDHRWGMQIPNGEIAKQNKAAERVMGVAIVNDKKS